MLQINHRAPFSGNAFWIWICDFSLRFTLSLKPSYLYLSETLMLLSSTNKTLLLMFFHNFGNCEDDVMENFCFSNKWFVKMMLSFEIWKGNDYHYIYGVVLSILWFHFGFFVFIWNWGFLSLLWLLLFSFSSSSFSFSSVLWVFRKCLFVFCKCLFIFCKCSCVHVLFGVFDPSSKGL